MAGEHDEHDRIYKQNADQYEKIHENSRRLSTLEADMRQLKTDLIGVNGLRGEFRAHKRENDEQMKALVQSVNDLRKHIGVWLKWTVGTVIAAAGVIVALTGVV